MHTRDDNIELVNLSLDEKEIPLIRSKPSIVVVGLSPMQLHEWHFVFFTPSMPTTLCWF